jgi:RES domain-containing protein
MKLWRISNHASLSGDGGLYAAGRWHSRGRRVVYLADHPASALIEVMVHLEIDAEDLPGTYQLLGVDVPDDIGVTVLDETELRDDWRERTGITRERGDAWLRSVPTALLRVPSAIVPHTPAYLLNPAHPEAARIDIASALLSAFDPRLMRFVAS